MIIAKRGILFIFILVLLFLNDTSLAADRLRISYSGPSISNALLWVSKEGKLFEKNRLDVEVIYLAGSLGQSALIAGETQFAVYTGLLMTPARLQGADVTMIASFLDHLLSRLVVRPDIKSAADLRGKRLGITRFGTASDFGMRLNGFDDPAVDWETWVGAGQRRRLCPKVGSGRQGSSGQISSVTGDGVTAAIFSHRYISAK